MMPNIRRGLAPGAPDAVDCARAKRGDIASSMGRDRATPAPRRKCRRDNGWRVAMNGARIGVQVFMRSNGSGKSMGIGLGEDLATGADYFLVILKMKQVT